MGFSDILSDAVKSIPLTEVLRERLALADDKFAILDREFANLKTENADLRQLVEKKDKEIADLKYTIECHEDPGACG